ncbi:MAG: methionine--tRNA ligase [Vicinamibacterales bacterium]
MSRFYITTPIYYINAAPHLGHAYTTLVADAVARAHRLLGDDVLFLTGTDEHGQKVERAAQKAGLPPKTFADQTSQAFRDLLPLLNASNDDFIRTTEPRHHASVQALWRRVRDNGYIYKGKYEGWYCTVDEVFVPETQLVAGKCPMCGNAVEKIAEESYFFRLSAFQQPLLEHYRNHPDFVTPAGRKNEMLSFIEAGLEDLSVSRTSFSWGIPVPDDPAHVMYVWFDALTNYMTAAGYGSDDPADRARFETFWPADVHVMGKEIVRQHAIYWPAFLMAAGLPLPKQVVSHGWWLMDGAKMSKSLGNVVRPADYIAKFGLDAFRYFVYREMVFGQDASFTDEAILARYNADLANDLGNLASRVTTLLHRNCAGRVPAPDAALLDRAEERDVRASVATMLAQVPAAVRSFQLNVALRHVWDVIGMLNRYIVTREPWKLAKDPARRAEMETSLYVTADALRVIAEILRPFMPETAGRTAGMLGQTAGAVSWSTLQAGTLEPGTVLGPTVPLFPRIELTVEALREMSNETPGTPAPVPAPPASDAAAPAAAVPAAAAAPAAPAQEPPASEPITYEDFMKVDLRVAKILEAERVPKSKKLMKLRVDTGFDTRTIVAGIAEAYEPEQLINRTIAVVFNLKPAKLMGIESNGMVLAGSAEGGKPFLVGFETDLPPGSRVR